MELIQAFRQAAEEVGVELKIYATDISNSAPALKFVDKVIFAPKIDSAEYLPFLLDLCKNEKINALIPTIDTDLLLLSDNREKFTNIGTEVFIAEYEKVAICRDKTVTGKYFASLGLSAPMSYDNYVLYAEGFPAFIKPKDGSSSIDAYKVNNKEELKGYAGKIKEYVVQPFISGEEYTVDAFCDLEGNPIYITPRKRLAVRAGEVLKTQISNKKDIIEEVKIILSDFKPRGAITIQLIRDEEKKRNWYIEINPRYGGGAPLSIKAGANSPKALIEILRGEKIRFMENAAEEGATFSRFDQSIRIDS